MGRNKNDHIRKPEILHHAYQIVAKEGFENTSLAKIADSMGVAKSMILHYFGSKEKLFEELFQNMFKEDLYPHWLLNSSKDTQKEKLEILINYFFGQEYANAYDDIVFYSGYYLGLTNPIMRKAIKESYDRADVPFIQDIQKYLDEIGNHRIDAKTASCIFTILEEGLDFLINIDPVKYDREKIIKVCRSLFWKLLEDPEILKEH